MEIKNIENLVLFQIDKTSKLSKLYSQRAFDKLEVGITVEQWIILKIIAESSSLSQKELADKSLRNPSSITRTLDLLQKKSFIQREQIPDNRRQYNILLTKSGATFVKKYMPIVNQHRDLSIKGFNKKEVQTLKEMLIRIQNNMK